MHSLQLLLSVLFWTHFIPTLGNSLIAGPSYANPIVPINDWARRCYHLRWPIRVPFFYFSHFHFATSNFHLSTSCFQLVDRSGRFSTSGLSFSYFRLPASGFRLPFEAESTKMENIGNRKMEVRKSEVGSGKMEEWNPNWPP